MVSERPDCRCSLVQELQLREHQCDVLRIRIPPAQWRRPPSPISADLDGLYGICCGTGAFPGRLSPLVPNAAGWPSHYEIPSAPSPRFWMDHHGDWNVHLLEAPGSADKF